MGNEPSLEMLTSYMIVNHYIQRGSTIKHFKEPNDLFREGSNVHISEIFLLLQKDYDKHQ